MEWTSLRRVIRILKLCPELPRGPFELTILVKLFTKDHKSPSLSTGKGWVSMLLNVLVTGWRDFITGLPSPTEVMGRVRIMNRVRGKTPCPTEDSGVVGRGGGDVRYGGCRPVSPDG